MQCSRTVFTVDYREIGMPPIGTILTFASVNGKWLWSLREPSGHERCLSLINKLLKCSNIFGMPVWKSRDRVQHYCNVIFIFGPNGSNEERTLVLRLNPVQLYSIVLFARAWIVMHSFWITGSQTKVNGTGTVGETEMAWRTTRERSWVLWMDGWMLTCVYVCVCSMFVTLLCSHTHTLTYSHCT